MRIRRGMVCLVLALAATRNSSGDTGGNLVKLVASFENGSPFSGGEVVAKNASEGRKSLRLDKNYASMEQAQDWSGFDFLKADLFTEARKPINLYVEVRDKATDGYWTRVNYSTVVPPGKSTLIIPVKQLYVGEKARPGRMLILNGITRLVFGIGEEPPAPLFIDNLRLERDDAPNQAKFDGLFAFDFGTATSPVMEGFTPITPGTEYTRGRGYGLKDARIWRAFDALQPEPLYQDFICIEAGGLAVDVPNGRYHVFVNIDSPSGFWGEYQTFRQRRSWLKAGHWCAKRWTSTPSNPDTSGSGTSKICPPTTRLISTRKRTSARKQFDVDVSDGQLNLEFQSENWGCSVSAVVIYPVAKAKLGEAFLKHAEARRRFYFDNYFKRILPEPSGEPLKPTAADRARGFVAFERDWMQDVAYNETPKAQELAQVLKGEAFAGELEPVTVALVPLSDLGQIVVTVSDLIGAGRAIPKSTIDVGFVSYRLSRVTSEGTVYTITPRLLIPGGVVPMPKGVTRRLWLTVRTPSDVAPGIYKGAITIRAKKGGTTAQIPIEFRVRSGNLDPVDIPAGPFGYTLGIPWFADDPRAARYNQQMMKKSLQKMRVYGFTACSGLPSIAYQGFANGKPTLDFTAADAAMKLVKEMGFLATSSYGGGVSGFNAYFQDTAAMSSAGFTEYAPFVKAIYSQVQKHAAQSGWVPVYYNLADEPIGDDLVHAAENAEQYRRAFPKPPPYFTGASSFTGSNREDPHFRLAKALSAVAWNDHDEASVALLQSAGADWAFYNGGSRWTFGEYMFKAAKQFGMKYRLSWHWNTAAGDPYYALDCREDDYAWCNASPDGVLIPSVEFERLREGLDDYRRLITLDRLAGRGTGAAAKAPRQLIAKRMAHFKLGQRDHDALYPREDWVLFRRQVDDLIEALRK